jgi:hypothetical protein
MNKSEFEDHMNEVFGDFIKDGSFEFTPEALEYGLEVIGYLCVEIEINLSDVKDHEDEIQSLRRIQAVAKMLSIACDKYNLRIE